VTANQWKLLLGGASAVVAFLLVQTDIVLDPIAKVALGAASVFLAVIKTGESAPSE
jgi:hypothetical protein